jgi:choline monooxygenase
MGNLVDWKIAADIRRASTLPSKAYRDPALYELAKERVFARSWQWAGDGDAVRAPGQVQPFTLLEGLLDEPLLLVRDGEHDYPNCLSNVCTHRGALVCPGAGVEPVLRCRYHGRRFDLHGRLLSMPEFEGVQGFPSPADDLGSFSLCGLGKFLFVNLADRPRLVDGSPARRGAGRGKGAAADSHAARPDGEAPPPCSNFLELIAPLCERAQGLPWEEAVFDPLMSRDYVVRANWALYCDNYLEGFHIPYVHAALAGAIDYGSYRTELFPWSNLQVGLSRDGDDVIELPPGSPDHGQPIAAFYYWMFPNTMLNVYRWGVSVNVVKPLAIDRTRVSFLSYVWDPAHRHAGAGGDLDRVEREDEVVVESVQRGLASRVYRRGRYSPSREQGVHHFHRLLTRCLAGEL